MSATGKPEPYRLGFLTAIEVPDKGFVGGLLVTNHFGRPLEFQSTVPIKPNPTQEILYGPTLEPFLLGELIATALIEKSGVKPHLVLTDREQILAVREHIESPVAWVKLEDGKTYQVQYFERVRMEYHPENQPPYDVLLGQFGRRILAGNRTVNVFHRGFAACDRYAGGEAAARALACPVLFVLGNQDQMTPPRAAQGLIEAARASGQRVDVASVPMGHHQMTEAPEQTLAALRAFLGVP